MAFDMAPLAFWASLTVNVCCFQGYFGLRLFRLLTSLRRKICCRNEEDCRDSSDEHILKFFDKTLWAIETQVLGWISIYYLAEEVSLTPFVQLKGETAQLVFVVFSIHLGKLIYKGLHKFCMKGEKVASAYYAIHILIFLIVIYPGPNSLLGLLAIASENSDIHLTLRSILEIRRVPQHHASYLATSYLGVVLTLVFRCIFPVMVLSVALIASNPFFMDNLEVVVFFFYLTFSLAINVWSTVFSVLKLQEIILIRRLYTATMSKLQQPTSDTCQKERVSSPSSREVLLKQWFLVLKNILRPSSVRVVASHNDAIV